MVGAGGAGMTAALAAASPRPRDRAGREERRTSAGPPRAAAAGSGSPATTRSAPPARPTTRSYSKLYLASIVGDVVPRDRRDTYIDRGPEVMDFIRERTPVRFAWVPQYADYHPEAPGGRPAGRSVEPVPMDARFLGDELDRLHPQYTKAPANLIVTQADFRKISLGLRTWRGPVTMAKVLVRRVVSMLRRPQDVRDGQRARDRAAQGAGRRRRTRPLRQRADRAVARGRPRGRRPRPRRARGSSRSGPAAA